jgi:hypothetical protein
MARARKTGKKRRPQPQRTRRAPRADAPPSRDELARAKTRFRELAGAAWSATKVPAELTLALATIRQGVPPPAGGPLIVVVCRKRQGTGCEQVAEIAGFYEQKLAPGQACGGQQAVLDALNAAAAAECMATLECPSKCPCQSVPRQQLAIYRCQNGIEEGFLLQGERVWNCMCFAM